MSGAAPGQNAQWLLLDVAESPHALATLRRGFKHVPRLRLFEGTEFQPVSEQGPRLVDLRECPALSALCHTDPHTWRGLLLGSEAPFEHVHHHLQCMLTVSVGGNHRALLNYCNRQVASYFFDACDARQLSRWLGPVGWIRWFGGTWADRANGSQGWQQLRNPWLEVELLGIEESLSHRQRERLRSCLLDQHIWRWSQSTGTDYAALSSHLQQGLTLGLSERAVLDDWLWLRLQYPRGVLVQPPPGLNQAQRLEFVRRHWENGQP